MICDMSNEREKKIIPTLPLEKFLKNRTKIYFGCKLLQPSS